MGRPKGAKNIKDRFVAELVATRLDYDPLETLIYIAKGDWKKLGYDKPTLNRWTNAGIEYEEDIISLTERNKAATQIAKYLYSQKQAIDLTSGGEGFKIIIEDYCKK